MKLYNVPYNAKSMMHYKYKSTFAIDYNKPVIVSKVCLIKNQNMQQHLTQFFIIQRWTMSLMNLLEARKP